MTYDRQVAGCLAVAMLVMAGAVMGADEVKIGDSVATVEAALGNLQGTASSGGREWRIYERGAVRFQDEKVVEAYLGPSRRIEAKRSEPAPEVKPVTVAERGLTDKPAPTAEARGDDAPAAEAKKEPDAVPMPVKVTAPIPIPVPKPPQERVVPQEKPPVPPAIVRSTVAASPAPSALTNGVQILDRFDNPAWFLEHWDPGATVTARYEKGWCQIELTPGTKGKMAWSRSFAPTVLRMEKTDTISLDVDNARTSPCCLALALWTSAAYYESLTQEIAAGSQTLLFPLSAPTYKCAASNWQNNATVEGLDQVSKLSLIFYSTNITQVTLDNLCVDERLRRAPATDTVPVSEPKDVGK